MITINSLLSYPKKNTKQIETSYFWLIKRDQYVSEPLQYFAWRRLILSFSRLSGTAFLPWSLTSASVLILAALPELELWVWVTSDSANFEMGISTEDLRQRNSVVGQSRAEHWKCSMGGQKERETERSLLRSNWDFVKLKIPTYSSIEILCVCRGSV